MPGASVGVHVQRLRAPRLGRPRIDLLGEHLGGRHRHAGLDRETPVALLLGQRAEHARVGDDDFRPVAVQRVHRLVERCRDVEPRNARPAGDERGEELPGDVDVAGRADRDQARVRADADPGEPRETDRDPVRELLVGIDEHARHPGRAGGGEDAVLAAVGLARLRIGDECVKVGESQVRIGHDAVELLHQGRLRQRREVGERGLGRVAAERLAVVRRAEDGMLEDVPKSLGLQLEQLLAAEAVEGEELAGTGAQRVEGHRVGAGCGGGHAVLPSGEGTASPRR
jgi:hypothetical protein